MSDTKQKILNTALELFNTHGVSQVSLRDIATTLKISVGNLQYHFNKRDQVIEGLYFRLVGKIDSYMLSRKVEDMGSSIQTAVGIFSLMCEYKFISLDFVTIIRGHQSIALHYNKLLTARQKEFISMTNTLVSANLIRKEELRGEFKNLFKRIELISNFLISNEINSNRKTHNSLEKVYLQLISQTIYPYLTETGKEQYLLHFPEQRK